MAWDKVCRHLELGGLGISRMGTQSAMAIARKKGAQPAMVSSTNPSAGAGTSFLLSGLANLRWVMASELIFGVIAGCMDRGLRILPRGCLLSFLKEE